MRWMRAAVLTVAGALLTAAAWGPLRNLFSDYQDSPAWVYWSYGGVLLALAAVCFLAAWRTLRRRERP